MRWNENQLFVCWARERARAQFMLDCFCATLFRWELSVNALSFEMTKLNFNRNDFHNSMFILEMVLIPLGYTVKRMCNFNTASSSVVLAARRFLSSFASIRLLNDSTRLANTKLFFGIARALSVMQHRKWQKKYARTHTHFAWHEPKLGRA